MSKKADNSKQAKTGKTKKAPSKGKKAAATGKAKKTAPTSSKVVDAEVLPPEEEQPRTKKTASKKTAKSDEANQDAAEQEHDDLESDDLDDEDIIDEGGDESAGDDDDVDDFVLPAAAKGPNLSDPLHLYLREVSRFPMLKQNEEFDLARRVRDYGDTDAAFRLTSSHLRLVVKIAMDFQRRWMQNVLDLIQEGNVGLMRAVQKFDPEKGIKFSYYASFWIKAYILKFIMDNWRLVKIGTTQAQRKLFYNLNKERQRLIAQGYDPDSKTLSENLNVSREQVEEMDQRLGSNDVSLNAPMGEDGSATRMDYLPALEPGIEDTLATGEMASVLHQHLKTIAPELNEKERDILDLRLLSDSPVTLREIGEKYGITRERVRQLEARLLQKIRAHLSREIDDFSRDWIDSKE